MKRDLTVSPRTLLRHRHIFVNPHKELEGKDLVSVWDFSANKAVVSCVAHSENDKKRYVSNWAKSHRVPPEAIIVGEDPVQYKARIERELEDDAGSSER